MRKWIAMLALAAVLACALAPHPGYTEDRETVLLARAIYALARGESYETKLAIGTVVMNRVDSPWYPDTVLEVLRQPHQFACGTLYDESCYQAARAVMMGRRTLPADAVIYRALDASAPAAGGDVVKVSGNYEFKTAG